MCGRCFVMSNGGDGSGYAACGGAVMRAAVRLRDVGRCYACGGAIMRRDLVLCVRRSGYAA